jgi:hypothetical protein
MSAMAKRQKSCAACGRPLEYGKPLNAQVLIDGAIRWIVCHETCSVICNTKLKEK